MSTRILIFLLALSLCNVATADTIVLKNGRRIEVEKVWEDGGQIKGSVYGATIGYPKDQVKNIEREKNIQNDAKEMLGFDIWTLGMDIDDMMRAAERNDIPLRKEGLIGINKHFQSSVRKYAQSATQFYYDCEHMGRWAKVKLNFTPTSKQLSKITLQWRGLNADNQTQFTGEIEELLISKYSAPVRRYAENLFFDRTEWEAHKTGTISMRSSHGAVDVEYTDKIFDNQEKAEIQNIQGEKKERYQSKDSGKF
ncbi:MAG: hypothetical protein PVG62_08595 [Desulfobacterales bacterium]